MPNVRSDVNPATKINKSGDQKRHVGSGAGAVASPDGRAWGLCSAGFPVGCATPATMIKFLAPFPVPARRTVHAVLPHTAHRRRSPPAFGLSRQSRKGLG